MRRPRRYQPAARIGGLGHRSPNRFTHARVQPRSTSAFPSRLYPKAVRGIRNDKHPPWKPDPRMVRPIHIALLVVAMSVAAAADAAPRRIESLNLCADQLLIALADRDQIAALTQFARDPTLSHEAADRKSTRLNSSH